VREGDTSKVGRHSPHGLVSILPLLTPELVHWNIFMLDEYGFEKFEDNTFPRAYLLTFRTVGTWLHGDQRGSNQRIRKGPHSSPHVGPNVPLHERMAESMRQGSTILNLVQREHVATAIREVCMFRGYNLSALNVRSNHGHAVVSGQIKPERIVNEFKAYSTRRLRQEKEFSEEQVIWSRGASTLYLWKPRNVEAAIGYVLYSQGDVPPETIFVD
jgi:REP element-mobilizing transposase RayT